MPAQLRVLSKRMVTVRGHVFDTIKIAFQPVEDLDPSKGHFWDKTNNFVNIWRPSEETEEYYCHTKDSQKMAFWYTLCGGIELIVKESQRYIQRLERSTWLSKCSHWETFMATTHQLRHGLLNDEIYRILTAIEEANYRRRRIQTTKGYYGLAPEKCKEGDLVVVLPGGNLPYIIRPVASTSTSSQELEGGDRLRDNKSLTETRYTILGDSYVHGIMDGEAFDLIEGQGGQLQEIILV
jgi:hypothetical protein